LPGRVNDMRADRAIGASCVCAAGAVAKHLSGASIVPSNQRSKTMASHKLSILVALAIVSIASPAAAQGAGGGGGGGAGGGAGAGGTGGAGAGAGPGGAAAGTGSAASTGLTAPVTGNQTAYSSGTYTGPAKSSGLANGNSGNTGSTGTTGTAGSRTSKTTNYFVPADPSLSAPSISATAQKNTALGGTNTAPQATTTTGAVSAPGVGVGHSANGQPIGSSGSGLGSPEQPIDGSRQQ
jgi:hypothetical protein